MPASHTTCSVVRSDKQQNSKYGRSATGAERPIQIPSTYYVIAQGGTRRAMCNFNP